ncbi:MAG: hypothetical protein AAF533_04690 [Acidobacteriota bacterium]
MRRNVVGFAALLALLLSTQVLAGVRLEPGFRPSVSVKYTPTGPWTVEDSEALADTTSPLWLNPNGDLVGDGPPSWDVLDSTALIAWISPTTDSIRMATSSWAGWSAVPTLPIEVEAIGTPVVVGASPHFFVAWRSAPSAPRVSLIGVLPDGRTSNVLDVGPGLLLGLAPLGETAHLLLQVPGSELVTHAILPIDHAPFEWDRSAPIVLEAATGAPSNPTLPGRLGRRGLTPPPVAFLPERRSTDFRAHLHSGTAEAGPWVVATWWPSPWKVKAMPFDVDGPLLSELVELPSVTPYSQETEDAAVTLSVGD